MIYDKAKTARLLRAVLDVTGTAIDLATRPGGEPSLRLPALEAEKVMRALAAKGDADAMYHEYVRFLQQEEFGRTLQRHGRISFESEFYRFVRIYREQE